MTPITCSCEKCRRMCANSTCLPTTDEARQLIRAGYADRMGVYVFDPAGKQIYVAPAQVGRADEVLHMTVGGPCSFFKDGLCGLHDKGLKPFEGRIAHHDRDWKTVRLLAMSAWKGKAGMSVRAALDRVRHQGRPAAEKATS